MLHLHPYALDESSLSIARVKFGHCRQEIFTKLVSSVIFPPGVTGLNVKCFACVDKVCEPYVHSSILRTILSAIYIINIQTAKLRSCGPIYHALTATPTIPESSISLKESSHEQGSKLGGELEFSCGPHISLKESLHVCRARN